MYIQKLARIKAAVCRAAQLAHMDQVADRVGEAKREITESRRGIRGIVIFGCGKICRINP